MEATYTLSLQGNIDVKLNNLIGSVNEACHKFGMLEDKTKVLQNTMTGFGNTIDSLYSKMSSLGVTALQQVTNDISSQKISITAQFDEKSQNAAYNKVFAGVKQNETVTTVVNSNGRDSEMLNSSEPQSIGVETGDALNTLSVITAAADKLTLSVSNMEAAVVKSATLMEGMSNVVHTLNTSFSGFGNRILSAIEKPLSILNQQFQSMVSSIESMPALIQNISQGNKVSNPFDEMTAGVKETLSLGSDLMGLVGKLSNLSGFGTVGIILKVVSVVWELVDSLGVFSEKMTIAEESYAKFANLSAAFHVELSKQKSATQDLFTIAMDAAKGSEARAAAIKKINDQYATFLPNLLTEKSTNDDLAVALQAVNVQIEAKIKAKFKEQALTEAMKSVDEAEKALYVSLAKYVSEDELSDASNFLSKEIQSFKNGAISIQQVVDNVSGKYRLTDRTPIPNRQGITFYFPGEKQRITPIFQKFGMTWERNKKENTLINAMYDPPKPNNYRYTGIPDALSIDSSRKPIAAESSMSGFQKWTTTTAASTMLFVPSLSTEATAMPQVSDRVQYGNSNKGIGLNKFCDSIVIQIDKADGKGYSQIQQEVEAQLKKMLDEYEA